MESCPLVSTVALVLSVLNYVLLCTLLCNTFKQHSRRSCTCVHNMLALQGEVCVTTVGEHGQMWSLGTELRWSVGQCLPA